MSENKKIESGANAVGHNSVFKAVATAVIDLFGNKNEFQPLTAEEENLEGKTCLVTGANSGLGKAVAIQLAQKGAHVIMACRSGIPKAGEEVRQVSGSDKVEMLQVDLADLSSVGKLCDQLRDRKISVDITVLNAGLMPLNARKSEQGYELMFAVHFLANRLFLQRCIDDSVIKSVDSSQDSSDTSRIIFVSSEAHQSSDPIDFDHFGEFVDYGLKEGIKHYGYSKLHMSTLAEELARQLNPSEELKVAVHALCPGPVASNIARESPTFLKPVLTPIFKLFFRTPEVAAEPVIYLACAKTMGQRQHAYLHMMKEKSQSQHAVDPENGKLLWEKSKKLIAEFL